MRTDLAVRRKSQEEIRGELNTFRVELGECDVRVESIVSRAADEMDMSLPDLFDVRRRSRDKLAPKLVR